MIGGRKSDGTIVYRSVQRHWAYRAGGSETPGGFFTLFPISCGCMCVRGERVTSKHLSLFMVLPGVGMLTGRFIYFPLIYMERTYSHDDRMTMYTSIRSVS